MFEFMQPDGHVVLNGDDDKLAQIPGRWGNVPVFFGMEKQTVSMRMRSKTVD